MQNLLQKKTPTRKLQALETTGADSKKNGGGKNRDNMCI
jgi:hypothetical protein